MPIFSSPQSPPIATADTPGSVPHLPLTASELNLANLTNHDKCRFDAISALGGDGSTLTDFWDDFDNLIATGNGTAATSTGRPTWGQKLLGTDSLIGQVALQKPSYFTVKDAAAGLWLAWNVVPLVALSTQTFYFTAKGLFKTAASLGATTVSIDMGNRNVSIGIDHAYDATLVALGESYSADYVSLINESATVPVQVDVYCLGTTTLHYRVNGGAWQTKVCANLASTPTGPSSSIQIYQTVGNTISLDWVGLFLLKS